MFYNIDANGTKLKINRLGNGAQIVHENWMLTWACKKGELLI